MNDSLRDLYNIMVSSNYRVTSIEFKRSVPHIYYESWPLQRGYHFEGLIIIQRDGIEMLTEGITIWEETTWQFIKRRLKYWWIQVWNALWTPK